MTVGFVIRPYLIKQGGNSGTSETLRSYDVRKPKVGNKTKIGRHLSPFGALEKTRVKGEDVHLLRLIKSSRQSPDLKTLRVYFFRRTSSDVLRKSDRDPPEEHDTSGNPFVTSRWITELPEILPTDPKLKETIV